MPYALKCTELIWIGKFLFTASKALLLFNIGRCYKLAVYSQNFTATVFTQILSLFVRNPCRDVSRNLLMGGRRMYDGQKTISWVGSSFMLLHVYVTKNLWGIRTQDSSVTAKQPVQRCTQDLPHILTRPARLLLAAALLGTFKLTILNTSYTKRYCSIQSNIYIYIQKNSDE